jgi:hypothetical protein
VLVKVVNGQLSVTEQLNLHPPAPITTEREDLLAAFRWWVEEYYNDLVFKHNKLAKKLGADQANYLLEDGAIKSLLSLESNLKSMIYEPHMGDCVKVACTCDRCTAEHLYNIPSSVNWTWQGGRKILKED